MESTPTLKKNKTFHCAVLQVPHTTKELRLLSTKVLAAAAADSTDDNEKKSMD